MSEPLIFRARAAAPLQAAYRALTEPAELRTWFAEHAEVDLPHRYAFRGRYTPNGDARQQRLKYADAHTLRFTWLLDGEETTTEITLAAETANSTIVSVSQTHFDFQEALSGSTIRGVLQTRTQPQQRARALLGMAAVRAPAQWPACAAHSGFEVATRACLSQRRHPRVYQNGCAKLRSLRQRSS
jgi:uncharacterized protein YndB with AHSA1/START domain